MENRTLGNTDVNDARDNARDVEVFGDGDMFKLLSKAHSDNDGWMKSTKALEINGVGCVVQVTTQQGSNVAEAVCFVPGVKIHVTGRSEDGKVTGRELVGINASNELVEVVK